MSSIAHGVRRALIEGLVEKGVSAKDAKAWATKNLAAGVARAQQAFDDQKPRRPHVPAIYQGLKDWAKSQR